MSLVFKLRWRPRFNQSNIFVTGEVERLLREYRQNQELVRNIGAHYYQIIYPVQLRHHEKMGISTREVGAQKVNFHFMMFVFQFESVSENFEICFRAQKADDALLSQASALL